MATVEQSASATNGASATGIKVENPATGDVIATVPNTSAVEVAAIVERARAAQPEWQAIGFDGRALVFKRAQKWIFDNADRIIETIVSETGKTHEDAQLAEIGYAGAAFGFWAKNAPSYLADERVRSSNPIV
ncbi:MAG TPA: aldehyde dehydrogenase family protein, partial [Solirubrobacteraceae bacterium]|nr:aldehyde dehydrogenase family protein [Solirubrobacteraceae bacterium]